MTKFVEIFNISAKTKPISTNEVLNDQHPIRGQNIENKNLFFCPKTVFAAKKLTKLKLPFTTFYWLCSNTVNSIDFRYIPI